MNQEMKMLEFSGNEGPTVISEAAAFEFWGCIQAGYPEMITGESQLSGEDVGAFHKWLTGEHGDFPVQNHDPLPVAQLASGRFELVIDTAIAAADKVLRGFSPLLQPVPIDVRYELESCVKHHLNFNFPIITGHRSIDAMDLLQLAVALEDFTSYPTRYTDATTIGQMRKDLHAALSAGEIPESALPTEGID